MGDNIQLKKILEKSIINQKSARINSVVIGIGSKATHNNCVIIGQGLTSDYDGQIKIGNKDITVSRELNADELEELMSTLKAILGIM